MVLIWLLKDCPSINNNYRTVPLSSPDQNESCFLRYELRDSPLVVIVVIEGLSLDQVLPHRADVSWDSMRLATPTYADDPPIKSQSPCS